MGRLNLALANMQGWCGNQMRKRGDSFGKCEAHASKHDRSLLTDTLQSRSDGCQPLWSPRQRRSSLLTLRPSYSPWPDVVVILGSSDRNAFESLPLCPQHTIPIHLSLFRADAASQLCQSRFSGETEPRGVVSRHYGPGKSTIPGAGWDE